jgi:aminomethyltransferase
VFLDLLSTNRLVDLDPGRARYTIFCDESGGAIDDLVVFRENDSHWVVPNASNRETVVAWMKNHAAKLHVDVRDRSFETGMLALQGPRAAEVLGALGVRGLDALKYFHLRCETLSGGPVVLSRTGYTGEDGFEVLAPAGTLVKLWNGILEAGKPLGLVPVGFGARDTLRLEAGLCLYGHELTREKNPIEAGLDRFVKFKDREFIAKARLLSASRDASPQVIRLVGLTLDSRRIARTGQDVLSAGKPVGEITSGTFSPTLEKSIAMGYVSVALSIAGAPVEVGVSHEAVPAVVTALPFYTRRK